jgi:hypothetical protein
MRLQIVGTAAVAAALFIPFSNVGGSARATGTVTWRHVTSHYAQGHVLSAGAGRNCGSG